ncbi:MULTISPECIES: metallophosphoesterase family protein [Pseudomonas]|uniref:Serine/threonine protein phosphatase n=1 Tax=Pseudomonas quercus TaxID=2722792 RepID=A0ABX0YHD2_9PSED|nr:metallophosphoesterase [Pseudomonas sp. LY10J]MBF7143282.1 metallophosphoesterase family protein [Pseudomonas sp. LY10J]NJP01586.1 serine/threonine protein phosphatase [Pseudomonas quercus]
MKLYVVSDLHNEFSLFEVPSAVNDLADLTVLAGDIDKKSRGVSWANGVFQKPVVYVGGNHEYYQGHIDRTLIKMREAAAQHVHVLENQALVIGDVRVVGATAWTDFSLTHDTSAASKVAREEMNDYRVIRAGSNFRRLRPDDVATRNRESKDWLARELEKPFAGKTIVVTHHCPLALAMGQGHQGHLSAAYSNDWPDLVALAHLWIFGHTHQSVDMTYMGCRLFSNPRGYPSEVTGFDPHCVIEI